MAGKAAAVKVSGAGTVDVGAYAAALGEVRALARAVDAADADARRMEAALTKVLRAVATVRGDVIDLEHARWAADGETDEGLQDVVAALQDVVAGYKQYL